MRTHPKNLSLCGVAAVAVAAGLMIVPAAASAQQVVTLDEARAMTRANSWDIASAQTIAQDAEITHDRAIASILPTVTLSVGYTLNDQQVEFAQPNPYTALAPYLDSVAAADPTVPDPAPLTSFVSEPAIISPRHSYSASLTVSQIIYDGRLGPAMRIARLMESQSEVTQDQIANELDRAVIQIYFGAVRVQRIVQVSEANLAIVQIAYDNALALQDLGFGNIFELTRAELNVMTAERQLAASRRSYDISLDALDTLLEINAEFDIVVPDDLVVPADLNVLIAQTQADNPDLRSVEMQQRLAEENVALARGTFLPTVLAQAVGTIQPATAFGGDEFAWRLMVNATWVIFAGGSRSADVAQAELDLYRLQIEQDRTADETGEQLTQAWNRVDSQQAQVDIIRLEVELARRTLALTTEAFELDAATAVDRELATNQLYISERVLAEAEVLLQMEVYELYRLAQMLDAP